MHLTIIFFNIFFSLVFGIIYFYFEKGGGILGKTFFFQRGAFRFSFFRDPRCIQQNIFKNCKFLSVFSVIFFFNLGRALGREGSLFSVGNFSVLAFWRPKAYLSNIQKLHKMFLLFAIFRFNAVDQMQIILSIFHSIVLNTINNYLINLVIIVFLLINTCFYRLVIHFHLNFTHCSSFSYCYLICFGNIVIESQLKKYSNCLYIRYWTFSLSNLLYFAAKRYLMETHLLHKKFLERISYECFI